MLSYMWHVGDLDRNGVEVETLPGRVVDPSEQGTT